MSINQLLSGKKGIIAGVANDKSMAWSIAETCMNAGAEICITYQGDRLKSRVERLVDEYKNCTLCIECDAGNERDVENVFQNIGNHWENIDFFVHAIAFSDKNELRGRYVDTTLDNFLNTMKISCYSFVRMAREVARFMKLGGSIVTLTYYGAEKVIPNYNVMGVAKSALESSVRYVAADLGESNIRVNSISAGPIRTLASSGIRGFKSMLDWVEENSPMRAGVSQADVANAALYLISELGQGVTGENLHVDNGYNIMGMKLPTQDEE